MCQIEEQKILKDSYDRLTTSQKNILFNWIVTNLMPIRYINSKHTSNELRELFEKSTNGFEITNNQMKYAMIKCGYKDMDVKDSKDKVFNISESSEIFK